MFYTFFLGLLDMGIAVLIYLTFVDRLLSCHVCWVFSVYPVISCSLRSGIDMFVLVIKLIRMGQIDDAFGKLRDWYPQIIPVSCLSSID